MTAKTLSDVSLKRLPVLLSVVGTSEAQVSIAPDEHKLVHQARQNPEHLVSLKQELVQALITIGRLSDPACSDGFGTLSTRQLEILGWVAKGKSNSVIATILGISPHTVDTHLRRAFERLGTTDRTVAVIRCMQMGVIETAA